MKVATLIGNCEQISSTFNFLPYVFYLILSFVRVEMNEWGGEMGKKIHPSLFLALGACVISTLGCRVPQSLCLLD